MLQYGPHDWNNRPVEELDEVYDRNDYQLVAVAATCTKITTQNVNDHAVNGARILYPRKETAADLQLRPHGQPFRRSFISLCHCICADILT